MLTKDAIIARADKKGRITTKELSLEFDVSRQYVSLLVGELIAEKRLIKLGGTRSASYVSLSYAKEHPDLIPKFFSKRYANQSLEEHKVLMEIEGRLPFLAELPENVRSIFTFAFSEMFNNAIEHSQSKHIEVIVSLRDNTLSFKVEDFGVGVFRNIMQKRHLNSILEAVQDLLKGKTTTMPKSHSGEGIFFTSKAANVFALDSFGEQLIVTPAETKIMHVSKTKRGTRVFFEIQADTNLHLTDIFRKYTNLTENSDYGFDKTEIRVKLFTVGGVHISRSQARRILAGLEKFQIIMLDFDGVPMVGQAFADEIYRVFQNAHPDITIQEENMGEGVKFMIERAKNEANKNNQE